MSYGPCVKCQMTTSNRSETGEFRCGPCYICEKVGADEGELMRRRKQEYESSLREQIAEDPFFEEEMLKIFRSNGEATEGIRIRVFGRL